MIIINIVIITIITMIIQSAILPYFEIAGVIGNISLPVLVSLTLLLNKPYGSISGLFLGFIQDVLFGPIVGINSFIYFVLSYILEIIEVRIGRMDRDNILIPILATALTTLIYNFLYYTLIFFIGSEVSFIYFIKSKLWKEIIYNCILCIPVYKLFSKIFKTPSIMFVRD